ncbi:MAG: hypothetical protein H0T05_00835 [Acidobacteria bacterium]|nr:hypothetical protein [Acidobacteriota bacterium]MBA3886110.1 hypothetical protein [Acidobacteriota bacterium]
MIDLLGVALLVTDALDACGIRYTIGGSLASSFSGEPRASIDVDIVVEMGPQQVQPFVAALGQAFYADVDAVGRAVRHRSTSNLIHQMSGAKVDLFVAGSPLDQRQLERRRRVQVAWQPDRFIHVHSPEDILLQKLLWYRRGGEASERQWRDALSILVVQQGRLDEAYLSLVAEEAGVSDLLDRARRQAASR